MSGYADSSVAGILNSGTAFLQKPFSEEELTQKVRQVLDTGLDKAPLPSSARTTKSA